MCVCDKIMTLNSPLHWILQEMRFYLIVTDGWNNNLCAAEMVAATKTKYKGMVVIQV